MYIASVVLFLIPASLLIFASISMKRHWIEGSSHDWRDHAGIASLIVGSLAILAGSAGKLAWWQAGGNPHGMGTPTGVWVILRNVFLSAMALSAFFAVLGKGRERVLILIALGCAFAVDTILYILQMD